MLRRLLGLEQITGFNSRSGPSLAARLGSEFASFGTTYLLLALAVPALVLMLRRGGPLLRMLGLAYLSAAAALGYAVTFGTLEENELYVLLVPSSLIVPVAVTLWHGGGLRRREHAARQRGRVATAGITTVLALVLGVNLATCLLWLLRPDDGYARLLQYMAAHVPAGSGVASVDDSPPQTHGTTFWALSGHYRVGPWASPAARAREHVRYVVVPWAEVGQGYSYLTPAQTRALVRNGRLLFSFHGRAYGDLALYQIPLPPAPGHARSGGPPQ